MEAGKEIHKKSKNNEPSGGKDQSFSKEIKCKVRGTKVPFLLSVIGFPGGAKAGFFKGKSKIWIFAYLMDRIACGLQNSLCPALIIQHSLGV